MAVLIELIHNADLALAASETGVIHEFSSAAWLRQLQGLARLFDWGTLRSVESAYEGARRLFDSCHSDGTHAKPIDAGDKSQRATCAMVAEDLLKAARQICSVVLSNAEQISFNSDIDAMLKRAEAANSINV